MGTRSRPSPLGVGSGLSRVTSAKSRIQETLISEMPRKTVDLPECPRGSRGSEPAVDHLPLRYHLRARTAPRYSPAAVTVHPKSA